MKTNNENFAVICPKCKEIMNINKHDEAIRSATKEEVLKLIDELKYPENAMYDASSNPSAFVLVKDLKQKLKGEGEK